MPNIKRSLPIVLTLALTCLALSLTACSEPSVLVEENLEKAREAELEGDYKGAAKLYRKVLDVAPENPDALAGLGEDDLRAGNHNSALIRFSKVLDVAPDHAFANYRLGYIYDKDGDRDQAKRHYSNAIMADLGIGDAYLRLADLIDEEDPNRAFLLYEEGLKLAEGNAENYYDYGNLLRKRKSWVKARAAYAKATQLEPDWAKAWFRLGSTLRELEEFDSAIKALDKAVKLKSDDVDYLYTHASALKDAERWDEAVTGFQKVLEHDPKHEKSLYKLASCYEKSGDLPNARKAYADAAAAITEDRALQARAAGKVTELR